MSQAKAESSKDRSFLYVVLVVCVLLVILIPLAVLYNDYKKKSDEQNRALAIGYVLGDVCFEVLLQANQLDTFVSDSARGKACDSEANALIAAHTEAVYECYNTSGKSIPLWITCLNEHGIWFSGEYLAAARK